MGNLSFLPVPFPVSFLVRLPRREPAQTLAQGAVQGLVPVQVPALVPVPALPLPAYAPASPVELLAPERYLALAVVA